MMHAYLGSNAFLRERHHVAEKLQLPFGADVQDVQQGSLSIEKVAEKMSHAVATCFQIADRGYIREGYWADLVMVNMSKPYTAQPNNVLYKCGWSPLEGFTFPATIEKTFVNGNLVYENGAVHESGIGMRLKFNR